MILEPHFCPSSQCFASQIVSFAETNKGASWLQKLNSTFIFCQNIGIEILNTSVSINNY